MTKKEINKIQLTSITEEEKDNIIKFMDDNNIKYESKYFDYGYGMSMTEYIIGNNSPLRIEKDEGVEQKPTYKITGITDEKIIMEIAKVNDCIWKKYEDLDSLSKDLNKLKLIGIQLGKDIKLRVAKNDTSDINGNKISQGEYILQLRDRILSSYDKDTKTINNPIIEQQLDDEKKAYQLYLEADSTIGIKTKNFDNFLDMKTYMNSVYDLDIYTKKENNKTKIKLGHRTIGEVFEGNSSVKGVKWSSDIFKISEIVRTYKKELSTQQDNIKLFSDIRKEVIKGFEKEESEISITNKLSKKGIDKSSIETVVKLEKAILFDGLELNDKQINSMDFNKANYFIEKHYKKESKENKEEKNSKSKMSENKFWKIIKKVEWKRDFNDERIKGELLDTTLLPENEREKFWEIKEKVETDLRNYLEGLPEKTYDKYIGESDDGLSDLVAHVVGLGESEYKKCINDYKECSKHSFYNAETEKDRRVENFFYSMHPIMDYVHELKEKRKEPKEEKVENKKDTKTTNKTSKIEKKEKEEVEVKSKPRKTAKEALEKIKSVKTSSDVEKEKRETNTSSHTRR